MVGVIAGFVLLVAIAAFAKAAMDTRTFLPRDDAFRSYPAWFRKWMQTRGDIPVIKIDDGWHAMQATVFLATGIAYLIAGAQYADYGLWIALAVPLRTIVHGIVFEWLYPML